MSRVHLIWGRMIPDQKGPEDNVPRRYFIFLIFQIIYSCYSDLPCLPTEAPVETVTVTPEPVTISLPAPIGPISISTDSITVDPIGSHFLPKVDEPPQLPPNWVEERFRVDRRKLEEMILGKLFQNDSNRTENIKGKRASW